MTNIDKARGVAYALLAASQYAAANHKEQA